MKDPKVNEYECIQGDSAADLTRRVNEKIKQGFQPFGSVALVFFPPNNRILVQGVVRYEDE